MLVSFATLNFSLLGRYSRQGNIFPTFFHFAHPCGHVGSLDALVTPTTVVMVSLNQKGGIPMSKGAKSISYLTKADVDCMNLFACVGNITEEQARSSGITEYRFNTYLNMDKIERVRHHEGTFYRLTEAGRQFASDLTSHEYVYHSNAFLHDSKGLFPQFIALSESEQSTWLTEEEQRRYCAENDIDISNVSVCDGIYWSDDGECIAVEVTTSTYKSIQIERKIGYCKLIGARYEQHRI